MGVHRASVIRVLLALSLVEGVSVAVHPAYAQIGRVAGVVKDEAGRPIKGAIVTAHNPDSFPKTFTSSTDEKGRFSMLGLRRGRWTLVAEAPGYDPLRYPMDVVTIKPNPPVEVRLVRGVLPAPPSALGGMGPREIQKRIDQAEGLAGSGDVDGAIAAYRALVTRVPALTSIYLQLGALYERKEDTASALAAYRQLADLEPGNTRAEAAVKRLTR